MNSHRHDQAPNIAPTLPSMRPTQSHARTPHMSFLLIVFLVARTHLYSCQNISHARAHCKSIHPSQNIELDTTEIPTHAATVATRNDFLSSARRASLFAARRSVHFLWEWTISLHTYDPTLISVSRRDSRWKPNQLFCKYWFERNETTHKRRSHSKEQVEEP